MAGQPLKNSGNLPEREKAKTTVEGNVKEPTARHRQKPTGRFLGLFPLTPHSASRSLPPTHMPSAFSILIPSPSFRIPHPASLTPYPSSRILHRPLATTPGAGLALREASPVPRGRCPAQAASRFPSPSNLCMEKKASIYKENLICFPFLAEGRGSEAVAVQ